MYMNFFYKISKKKENNESLIELDLFQGDDMFKCKLGGFEVLFIFDEKDKITSIEYILLMECPVNIVLINPCIFYINLPSDLLRKTDLYNYKMKLIDENSIFSISDYTDVFKKNVQKKSGTCCSNIYKTLEFPKTEKLRCKNVVETNDTCFNRSVLFNFMFWT